MRSSMVVVLLVGATANADAPKYFPSSDWIITELVALQPMPRVIAFGEYHQIKDKTDKIPSALKRFANEMLVKLAPHASDLIAETWVTAGACGKVEEQAVAKVEEVTQRPAATESELVTLLKRAKANHVQPHILTVTCDEYARLQPGADGEMDYVRLLSIITTHLQKGILEALQTAPKDRAVLVYGGALHNDVFPQKGLETFSFARAMIKRTGGKYLEVDLYVPEYVETDKTIAAEPWFAAWQKSEAEHAGQPALIRRAKNSYIVMFPRTAN